MKRFKSFLFILLLMLIGCTKSEITDPPYDDDYNLVNTTPVPDSTMGKMEGIYKISSGSESLGSQFVCKVSRSRVSFFSDVDGIFIILKHGYNSTDGSIQFSGFWRYSEFTTQGKIHFSISASEGATDLLAGVINNLKLQGIFSDQVITLQYDHAFSTYAINNPFIILGHHGVITTTNPPFSENSINAAVNSEGYGVNGLEFDVRLSSDHVPICIHDANINTRLTQKSPLSGNWDQYSFPLISAYIRLIDGQKLPSLEHVLDAFIDSTNLKYFWMDIKGNPDVFKYLEPVVRNAYAKAAAQNRNVVIFAGMPSSDVINEFHAQPTYSTLPTLCEESIIKCLENASIFFGPRFSLGLLLDDVDLAHNNGIKVISWTLNSKELIRSYLQDGRFDGFITDYPAYVVYDYYTMF